MKNECLTFVGQCMFLEKLFVWLAKDLALHNDHTMVGNDRVLYTEEQQRVYPATILTHIDLQYKYYPTGHILSLSTVSTCFEKKKKGMQNAPECPLVNRH